MYLYYTVCVLIYMLTYIAFHDMKMQQPWERIGLSHCGMIPAMKFDALVRDG